MVDFLTVPEELLPAAELGIEYFEGFGYAVTVERSDVAFPYTPALHCRRAPTTLIVEVGGRIDEERLSEWVAYGRSCWRDTRVAVLLPVETDVAAEDIARAQDSGYGLYRQTNGEIIELVTPVDLAVNIELPPLVKYSNRIRKALGPAFEQIRRGNWREGFEDACNALEDAARRYLIKSIEAKRVRLVAGGRDVTPSSRQIARMSLGQLKDRFQEIDNPNHADEVVGQALKRINPDRIRAAHKKRDSAAESALRRNVGKQIWVIVNALKELLS